jgi:hypothetical protein
MVGSGGRVPTNVATGGSSPNNSRANGGMATGGIATGGRATGGVTTSGAATGGVATGGAVTGGAATGGIATGGRATGGVATGGVATGGHATGGVATGGVATGGVATGGAATGGASSGLPPQWCLAKPEWKGCGGPSGGICREFIELYPYYTQHRPNCPVSDNCGGSYQTCSSECLQPELADLIDYQSSTCAGTQGGWDGCRGSGCIACVELLVDYPKYFERHPGCKPNCTCDNGGFFATKCSASCPAPTNEDR